ncbi:hypothetical protein DVH24_030254 [Malus domestica]|uniref:Glycoside hydrolase family 19 catalytic domain-containing protein n=1 Tax=Malus domestica TaxID=3750 RepID=A0A498KVP9_MALDO|nr:hypothetical protein DVH24_030254 [Malus domestica]
MTEQKPKPSSHDVMVGLYVPTEADVAANRTVGFGLVTNIINGGLECGIPNDARVMIGLVISKDMLDCLMSILNPT